jgi:hypothetical protein
MFINSQRMVGFHSIKVRGNSPAAMCAHIGRSIKDGVAWTCAPLAPLPDPCGVS